MIDINIPLATDKGLENIGRHLGSTILAVRLVCVANGCHINHQLSHNPMEPNMFAKTHASPCS
jgi:hypothetical protein